MDDALTVALGSPRPAQHATLRVLSALEQIRGICPGPSSDQEKVMKA